MTIINNQVQSQAPHARAGAGAKPFYVNNNGARGTPKWTLGVLGGNAALGASNQGAQGATQAASQRPPPTGNGIISRPPAPAVQIQSLPGCGCPGTSIQTAQNGKDPIAELTELIKTTSAALDSLIEKLGIAISEIIGALRGDTSVNSGNATASSGMVAAAAPDSAANAAALSAAPQAQAGPQSAPSKSKDSSFSFKDLWSAFSSYFKSDSGTTAGNTEAASGAATAASSSDSGWWSKIVDYGVQLYNWLF